MFLFNEKNESLNIEDVTAEFKDLANVPTPTLSDVEAALGNYYAQASQLQSARYHAKLSLSPTSAAMAQPAFLSGIGGNILAEIKKIICGLLDGNSTQSQIIQAVLSALETIIPGGVFIKALANIIVKYLLSTGIDAFCGIAPAALGN